MKKWERKQAIYEVLCRHPAGWKMADILAALGAEFKERTVRRLLMSLVEEDGLVIKTGNGKGCRYQVHPGSRLQAAQAHLMVGFDYSRCKYQSLQVALVGRIVRGGLHGQAIGQLVTDYMDQEVALEDREAFVGGVKQALKSLTPALLSQYQITPHAYQNWIAR